MGGNTESETNGDGSAQPTRELIGARLQQLREAQGLSLREAATKAELSRSFVAAVEKGESEIAVSRLIRLADVYGVGIPDLLEGTYSKAVEFLSHSAARVFPTGMETVMIRYLSSPSWQIQPFKVDLAPGAQLEDLRHPGDEFIHCMEGNPTIVGDGTPHQMEPGDTIVIASKTIHSYFNLTPEPAVLIGGVSRPDDQIRGGSII